MGYIHITKTLNRNAALAHAKGPLARLAVGKVTVRRERKNTRSPRQCWCRWRVSGDLGRKTMVWSWGEDKTLDGDRLNEKRPIWKENGTAEILAKALC